MNTNFYNSLSNHFGFKAVSKTLFIIFLFSYSSQLFAQSVPAAPTSVTASPSVICMGSLASLKATSPGNSIRWYTESTSTVTVGTSASGANFSVSPSVATTYYAEAYTSLGIASATRTSVTVIVNTIPEIISVPQDIMTSNTPGDCGAIINYPSVTVVGIPAPSVIYSQPSGTHFQVGTTTVLTTAVNTCGSSSLSFDVTVNDVEYPAMVTPPNINLTAPSGSTTVSNVDLGTPIVTDNCGEYTISNNAPSTFPGGTTVITWTVTDSHGHSVTTTQSVTVVVSNTAPVLNDITSNDADNIIAQFTCATLNIGWLDEPNGGPYTIDVDWRDSSAHTVLTGVSAHSVTPSHTYNKTGVFAPVIKISDGSNAKDTIVFKYLVVYIVGNYSTTTEGEFTAPAGSLVSNPNLSLCNRKVEFGVECKPKACHPGMFDGEVEIELNGGHFEFETEKIDWDYLAVSACFLATFEGSGYLYPEGHHNGCHGRCHGGCNNNSGHHYGILIVQSDKYKNTSNANKVRIKIWNIDNGAIVFDTQMGAPDYALPTTTLSKGCVKVKVPNNCVPRLEDADGMMFTGAFQTIVAPNPFTSDFKIDVSSMSESNINVEIYDVVGKLVQSIPNVSVNETFTVQNDLPTGVYFVRITQDENSQVVRVIKQ